MDFFNDCALVDHLEEVRVHGIASIPEFLTKEVCMTLLSELGSCTLTEAEAETGPFRIKQSYLYTTSFTSTSHFIGLAKALEQQLNSTCATHFPTYLSTPLHFTDLVVQRYQPCPVGISPHRDGLKYLNLIALFVLEGKGKFCLCDDRDGSNPREVFNEPGTLLLMRAPGFLGEKVQPFHFVGDIETQRTTFALRHSKV